MFFIGRYTLGGHNRSLPLVSTYTLPGALHRAGGGAWYSIPDPCYLSLVHTPWTLEQLMARPCLLVTTAKHDPNPLGDVALAASYSPKASSSEYHFTSCFVAKANPGRLSREGR